MRQEFNAGADHNEQVKISGHGEQWDDLRERQALRREQAATKNRRAMMQAVESMKTADKARERVPKEEEKERQEMKEREETERSRKRMWHLQPEQRGLNLDSVALKMILQSA